MSIAVEDWDELAEPRRRRDKRNRDAAQAAGTADAPRATPEAAPARAAARAPAARIAAPRAPGQAPGPSSRAQATAPAPPRPAALAREPEAAATPETPPVLGVAAFADDDYGDTMQNLRVPAESPPATCWSGSPA